MSSDEPNNRVFNDTDNADQDTEPTLKAPEDQRPDNLQDASDDDVPSRGEGVSDSPDQDAEPTRNAPPEVRPDGMDSGDDST